MDQLDGGRQASNHERSQGRASGGNRDEGTEGPVRLMRDPATGLLLERDTGSSVARYSVQEFTDIIPLEPTLEMSGCTAWPSC